MSGFNPERTGHFDTPARHVTCDCRHVHVHVHVHAHVSFNRLLCALELVSCAHISTAIHSRATQCGTRPQVTPSAIIPSCVVAHTTGCSNTRQECITVAKHHTHANLIDKISYLANVTTAPQSPRQPMHPSPHASAKAPLQAPYDTDHQIYCQTSDVVAVIVVLMRCQLIMRCCL